jgi:hypothetical protein
MLKKTLDKIPRRDAQQLLADEYPITAVTAELSLEWWRGYHTAKAIWAGQWAEREGHSHAC